MIVIETVSTPKAVRPTAPAARPVRKRTGGEAKPERVGEAHGEGDRGHVSPPEHGGDEHAGDLADPAAHATVISGADGWPTQRPAPGTPAAQKP